MKKLITLVPTEGKTQDEIFKETKSKLEAKGVVPKRDWKKLWLIIAIVSWVCLILVGAVGLYVNYFMSHGLQYATGEYVCQNDDRGPCAEEFREDMSNLDIPWWAKVIRKYGLGLMIVFALAGSYSTVKYKYD